MKSKQEAIDLFSEWFDNHCIGNLIFYRAPGTDGVNALLEETIKTREMSSEAVAYVEGVFRIFDFDKAELFLNKRGEPDRIKTVRRL